MTTNKENMNCTELLKYKEYITTINAEYRCKPEIEYQKTCKTQEKIEKYILELAIKAAKTPEELVACAEVIEGSNLGDDVDIDEWAEQIRIQAYGIERYLDEQLDSPAFQEFVRFMKNEEELIKGMKL